MYEKCYAQKVLKTGSIYEIPLEICAICCSLKLFLGALTEFVNIVEIWRKYLGARCSIGPKFTKLKLECFVKRVKWSKNVREKLLINIKLHLGLNYSLFTIDRDTHLCHNYPNFSLDINRKQVLSK